MRIYLIRHADPDYPNNTITPDGHEEAKALAKRMAGEKLDRIYSSPMGRALDTMRYTAEATGLEHTVEEWTEELRDCRIEVPPWESMAMWNLPGEVIREHLPLPGYDDWHEIPCLANPLFRQKVDELNRNSDAFLARHGYKRQGTRYRVVRPNRKRIALFCHGGFGVCWLAHLLEIPLLLMWSGFWLPPSSVTTILFDERSEHWAVPRLLCVGDTSHLYAAGLPIRPRGIMTNYD